MILNPFLSGNDNTILCLVGGCLLILAAIMIPKAIRHRKQTRENQPNSTKQKNTKIKMTAEEMDDPKSSIEESSEYKTTFLKAPKIVDRKTVFISGEIRDKIDLIVRRLADDRKMSVSGFIENLVIHHLQEYKEEIDRLKKH